MLMQSRFVLFADIKGFAKILKDEPPDIIADVWAHVARILAPHKQAISTYNTWGDALFLVFSDVRVVSAVLEIRDWFRNHRLLAIRIACHFGDFLEYDDEILGRKNAVGGNINLTARIEPITRPNAIFVTQRFKEAVESAGNPDNFCFDELGSVALAKNFGQEELLLLRRASEPRHVLDRLAKKDLSKALPDVPELTPGQEKELEELRNLSSARLLGEPKFRPDPRGTDAAYGKGLADLHRSRGNYDTAQEIVDALLELQLDADGLQVQPLTGDPSFVKLRANIATRRGDYDLAHRLLYDLYKSGSRDVDTLTMLASCYKRRAFFDRSRQTRGEPVRALLERSRDLYLEAVRKDIGDQYPVINAAFAYAFLREDGYANKLAEYCQELVRETHGRSWWNVSTLCQTEVVKSDYEEAERLFESAIKEHQPKPFERHAVADQLELLALVRNLHPGLERLIALLKGD